MDSNHYTESDMRAARDESRYDALIKVLAEIDQIRALGNVQNRTPEFLDGLEAGAEIVRRTLAFS
jgi:hypothetical protein